MEAEAPLALWPRETLTDKWLRATGLRRGDREIQTVRYIS
jgi:hypothetical protein